MSSRTDYLEDAWLDHVTGNTAFTQPTTLYLALYTAAPDDTGGGTEVTGGSYARQVITFGAASGGVATNDTGLSFTEMPATTVVAVAILDALTGGNMLYHYTLVSPKSFLSQDTAEVAIGAVTITAT